jgi:hypothetical protein
MLRNMHQISDFGVLAFWRRQVIHEWKRENCMAYLDSS